MIAPATQRKPRGVIASATLVLLMVFLSVTLHHVLFNVAPADGHCELCALLGNLSAAVASVELAPPFPVCFGPAVSPGLHIVSRPLWPFWALRGPPAFS